MFGGLTISSTILKSHSYALYSRIKKCKNGTGFITGITSNIGIRNAVAGWT